MPPATAQVVIIGAEVMGASIAYHLAARGCRGLLILAEPPSSNLHVDWDRLDTLVAKGFARLLMLAARAIPAGMASGICRQWSLIDEQILDGRVHARYY